MNINSINTAQALAMIRLSTAQRINSAADDASGLAISEKMRGQIRGENVAVRNMQDTSSLLNTAEGALGSTTSVLQRMRELSIQANNGLLTASDRSAIQQEYSTLVDTVNSIGNNTEFNTKKLLDGSLNDVFTTTNANGEGVTYSISSALASNLGDRDNKNYLSDVDLVNNPSNALGVIDKAIEQVTGSRSSIGAKQNRLDFSINVSENKAINMQAAESRIRDADMPKEINNFNRANILQQTYFATKRMQMMQAGQILNLIA